MSRTRGDYRQPESRVILPIPELPIDPRGAVRRSVLPVMIAFQAPEHPSQTAKNQRTWCTSEVAQALQLSIGPDFQVSPTVRGNGGVNHTS